MGEHRYAFCIEPSEPYGPWKYLHTDTGKALRSTVDHKRRGSPGVYRNGACGISNSVGTGKLKSNFFFFAND